MKNKVRVLRVLAFSLLLLPIALVDGCGPFWVNPYFTVKESSLNWVIIHYYNLKHKPLRRTSVELYGNGLVVVKKGTSELVSNDFAKRHKEDEWSKIKTFRVQLDPQQVHDIFQHLVNHGVVDRDKVFKGTKRDHLDRFIAVHANINAKTYSETDNIFEVDPDLAEELLDVVREFENPTL